jgi:hypothetical protein
VCRGIVVRRVSALSRPTAFDSEKLPELPETKGQGGRKRGR